MSGHDRAYRALLRLYPATFRDDYGEEMTRLFREQLRDARASNGRRAVAGLWTRAIADVLETAPGHHLRKEHRSARADPRWSILGRRSGPTRVTDPVRASSSASRLCGCCSSSRSLHRDSSTRFFSNPPSVAGLPAGIFIIAVAMTLMLAGVWLLRGQSRTSPSSSRSCSSPCLRRPDLRRSGDEPDPGEFGHVGPGPVSFIPRFGRRP